jgi:hypothetical protein
MKKSVILGVAATRAEYLRRYKAMERAKRHGLDTDLIDKFYSAMAKKGYGHEITMAAVFMAARDGAFGFVNKWER